MKFFERLFAAKKKSAVNIDYAEVFENGLALNAIELKFRKKNGIPFMAGTSKFGGKPDLPEGAEWPSYKGAKYKGATKELPLSFLLQINCSEIKEYDKDNKLPDKGMLYFFYELSTMKWGFDPADKGSAKVYYFDAAAKDLSARDFPRELEEEYRLPEMGVSFVSKKSLPNYEEYDRTGNMDEWDQYDEARMRCLGIKDEDINESKLLGYAELIQGDMKFKCEAVSNGHNCGTEFKGGKEAKEKIENAARDWTLLLQLDTIEKEDFELMFCDSGRIYYYIRKEDLAARKFDNCHLVLQCY